MTDTEPKTLSRNVKLDLFLPEESQDRRQEIINSVRHYRAVLRKSFAAFTFAQMAGATIDYNSENDVLKITPNNDASRQILSLSFGHDGKALGYQLREWVLRDLAPTWQSFVWDSLRRDLQTAWTAKDPEFPRASRGWLTLAGARELGRFNGRGIGFPVATARPKCEDHSLTLKWDHRIGTILFKLGKMDPGRYSHWRAIVNEDYGLGTIYLNERDGKLFAVASYSFAKPAERDGLTTHVVLNAIGPPDEASLLTITGANTGQVDSIPGHEALASLNTLYAQRMALESRRASCGAKSRRWGDRKRFARTQAILTRATTVRTRTVDNLCHAWARRIVDRALGWGCSLIILPELPSELYAHPWPWSRFETFVRYKAQNVGISVAAEGEA